VSKIAHLKNAGNSIRLDSVESTRVDGCKEQVTRKARNCILDLVIDSLLSFYRL
jgi:hypothetical protein